MTTATDLFQTIGDILTPHSKKKSLTHKSIQLPKGIYVIDESGNYKKVWFLTEGQRVVISEENKLVSMEKVEPLKPTHQITHCWSIDYDSFGITVIDLKTQELRKIQL